MHQIECLADVIQWHGVGDHRIDFDLAVHVPIDDLRNIGATFSTAKRAAFPHPAGDKLEGSSGDFLAGSRHTNDDRFAPAFMTTLQCLAHHRDVARAIKAVVGTAACEVHEIRDNLFAYFFGIHKVRHAKRLGHLALAWVDVHAHDHVGTSDACALHDVESNAAKTKNDHVVTRPNIGRIKDSTDTCGHAAADVTNLIEGRILTNLGERNLRNHGVIGKGARAHVMEDRFAVDRKTARAIGHEALALSRTNRLAEIGLARRAVAALATLGSVERNDVVAFLKTSYARADIDNHACTFVPQDCGKDAFWIVARKREGIGVADTSRFDFDQDFALLGTFEIDFDNGERLSSSGGECGACFHGRMVRASGRNVRADNSEFVRMTAVRTNRARSFRWLRLDRFLRRRGMNLEFTNPTPTGECMSNETKNNKTKNSTQNEVPGPGPEIAKKKGKAIDEALRVIKKQFGMGSIMRLGSNDVADVDVIPTGSLALDMALGIGGLPRGRIVEIYGPESSGKTTLTLHTIAEAQALGGVCAFVDAEHALDAGYAKALGISLDDLLVSQPDCGEEALEITDTLVRTGAIDLIVVDSVAALTPRAEIEGEMGDHHMALQARLMSQALRKLTAAVARTKTTVIFINQLRLKVGVVFGNPETTTGGNALKFYSSVRLDIRRKKVIKLGDEIIGSSTRVKVVKNKMAPPFREANFEIMYGTGVNRMAELVDSAEGAGLVEKSGAWYSYRGEKLGHGRDKAMATLKEQPAMAEELKSMLMQHVKDKLAGRISGPSNGVAS